MKTKKPLSRDMQFLLLSLLPLYFIAVALACYPWEELIRGVWTIIYEPDFLITDYFVIGGVGAAFLNAGILSLLSILIVYFLDMDMDGHTITSACLMFGFSLFGKNLMNIWAILLGVFLYAHYHKSPVSKYIYIGFYGTSLSPIITQVMWVGEWHILIRMVISLMIGITVGFVLPPLATHVHYAHKGYSLYNVGFAGGIIATIIVSLLKSFGIQTESRLIWSSGNNPWFLTLLTIFFGGMILLGIVWEKDSLKSYCNILKSTGYGGCDYYKEDGGAATLINMGVNGLFVTWVFHLLGGDLNGPTIGSIFTVVGFSATGKHLRNIVPVMFGVWLASKAKHWNITDPSPALAFMLSTTLAPIAGKFGAFAGILAGFLHSSVALNVGIVYGGMNLYNNGFAGGMVAIFLVPVIQSVKDRRARAKGGLSL